MRPGPIQGGMVHPYLQPRAKSTAEITYLREGLEPRSNARWACPSSRSR